MSSPRLALLLLSAFAAGCSAGMPNGTDGGLDVVHMDATLSDTSRSDASSADGRDAQGDAVTCPLGQPECNGACCASGQFCAGGYCCTSAQLCGGVCCGPNHTCNAGMCQLDCGTNASCNVAGMETCCAAGQVCYLSACTTPGAACTSDGDCPTGQYCETSIGHCLPRAMGTVCQYHPPVGMFAPVLKWEWQGDSTVLPSYNQVMMMPAVANLDDDNHDGRVDHNDIPDVVFITFAGSNYWSDGVVRAISGANGARIWPTSDPGYRATPGAEVSIAELDSTSLGPEIVTCTPSDSTADTAGHVMILGADGHLIREITGIPCGFSAAAIADVDHDGTPDIAVRNVLFHADGTRLPGFASATPETSGTGAYDFVTLANMDSTPNLELVTNNSVIHSDGTVLWTRTDVNGYPAVGDLNGDGMPEVVYVEPSGHDVRLVNGQTGADLWAMPAEVNHETVTNGPSGGGPPTIADFNGDGHPDIATAGGYNYLVLDAHGTPIWYVPSQDHSSRVTGSSVFDFDGDGTAEAVYNDELKLRIMAGIDGTALFTACNTSGTLWEYPVIVDVDNDDHAEIVVMDNNYAFPTCADGSPSHTGIKVYGDANGNWVRTRRIWNEHTYHVTNIDEDGNVPVNEAENWSTPGLNNFRQNIQPNALDAPDLVPADLSSDTTLCPASMLLRVRVVNQGAAGAPAGIPVSFYYGSPTGTHTFIGRTTTTMSLLPGESQVVSVTFTLPAGHTSDTFMVFAVINDPVQMPLTTLHECNTSNNTSVPAPFVCSLPG